MIDTDVKKTDELVLVSLDIGTVHFQTRWMGEKGSGIEYSVNGRVVHSEIYDRVLATMQARALTDIAIALDPSSDEGVAFELSNILNAIKENDDGEQRRSLVGALEDLAAAVRDRK